MTNWEYSLLDSRKTAQMLGVSERTLYTLREDGLPYVKIRGRIMYVLDDIHGWIRQNRRIDVENKAA